MHNAADAAAFFARVSRELLDQPEERMTLQLITERAVDVVPGCDASGISLRGRRGQVEAMAASSPEAGQYDTWQDELAEGPSLDALADEETCLVPDLRSETRWPTWSARVADAGVGSVLSVRLATESDTIGSLNLYAAKPFAFGADDVDLALVFASHAAAAVNAARLVTGLQAAVRSRHLIGVAQGIIMQRYDMSMDASFEVLRRYSSHANIKLREVAALVVEQRLLPARYVDLAERDGEDAAT